MRFVKLIAVAKAHVEPGFLYPCPLSRVLCPVLNLVEEVAGFVRVSLSALHVFNY